MKYRNQIRKEGTFAWHEFRRDNPTTAVSRECFLAGWIASHHKYIDPEDTCITCTRDPEGDWVRVEGGVQCGDCHYNEEAYEDEVNVPSGPPATA
tara:strand:- start:108 stop:392 length:285 start_codon:yes stop_codon:yes gene_type:complete